MKRSRSFHVQPEAPFHEVVVFRSFYFVGLSGSSILSNKNIVSLFLVFLASGTRLFAEICRLDKSETQAKLEMCVQGLQDFISDWLRSVRKGGRTPFDTCT